MRKNDKVHSIRIEISIVFIALMVGTFAMCLLVNLFFMERFYIQNKTEAIISSYRSISNAILNGGIQTDEFDEEIRHICERYDIEMIVLDAESRTVKAASNNADLLAKILWDNMISTTSATGYSDEKTVMITRSRLNRTRLPGINTSRCGA